MQISRLARVLSTENKQILVVDIDTSQNQGLVHWIYV